VTGGPGPSVPSGAALLDLVAVMDRLRSPGGCPWDAEQTHASLVPYLVEETYEAVEAIESGERDHMAEELGDVLLQVVFHARVAQEDEVAPFDIDDVAAGIAAKLRRRHPHVFGDVVADTPEAVAANWSVIKAAEKAAKGSGAAPPGPLHGIPAGMPPLAKAAAMVPASTGPDAVTSWMRRPPGPTRAPDCWPWWPTWCADVMILTLSFGPR
jgi:XTP/dITP diphosphohydrolase